MIAKDLLAKGDFSFMSQEQQPDGSVLITLTKRGDPRIYRLWIKDLYQPTEVVIKEEVT